MIVAGAIGGYVGAILSRLSPPDDADGTALASISVRESAFAGIAAAFVVPVFLAIASMGAQQSLIANVFQPMALDCTGAPDAGICRGFVPSLLLVIAFCIVVGASYRAFFAGISKRLLDALNDKVKDLNQEVEKLGEEEDVETPTTAKQPPNAKVLPDDESAVLNALIEKPRTRRAVGAIAMERKMPPPQVEQALSNLVGLGLAEELASTTKPGSKRFRVDVDALSSRVTKDLTTDKIYVK
ncbi:hypothetical protein GGD81_004525 [Rhodobium orientis]|nr:YEATS-associated helix-containing protein [Rhodobium orientis]MBB4305448.1 hypothetical protein [Rhodobium orientis]